jgi:ribosomal protein S18 acetylase RimI-like enzyme
MTDRDPEVHAFAEDDWRAYRAIRLAALEEAPYAFGSTLERELTFDEARWRQRLQGPSPAFHVLIGGEEAGLAGGLAPGVMRDDPHVADAYLVQMWVHPSMRGRGAGDALVTRVIEWARAIGARALRLWVVEDNVAAIRLYERHGFIDSGERQQVREDDPRIEIGMVLELASRE